MTHPKGMCGICIPERRETGPSGDKCLLPAGHLGPHVASENPDSDFYSWRIQEAGITCPKDLGEDEIICIDTDACRCMEIVDLSKEKAEAMLQDPPMPPDERQLEFSFLRYTPEGFEPR